MVRRYSDLCDPISPIGGRLGEMSKRIDLYNSTYSNFSDQVMAAIRHETYGEDIGQNSWITVE